MRRVVLCSQKKLAIKNTIASQKRLLFNYVKAETYLKRILNKEPIFRKEREATVVIYDNPAEAEATRIQEREHHVNVTKQNTEVLLEFMEELEKVNQATHRKEEIRQRKYFGSTVGIQFQYFCISLGVLVGGALLDAIFVTITDFRRNSKLSQHSTDHKQLCEDYTSHFRDFIVLGSIGVSWYCSSWMALVQIFGTLFISDGLFRRVFVETLEESGNTLQRLDREGLSVQQLNKQLISGSPKSAEVVSKLHANKLLLAVPAVIGAVCFNRTIGLGISLWAFCTTVPKLTMV